MKVVLPSSQKSWIGLYMINSTILPLLTEVPVGGAYQIKELTTGHYYYPQDPGASDNTFRLELS